MAQVDDELEREYLQESLEHLADIENDLLAIEGAGENIDEELVNKVFRAAHSIKGGAGFFNLTTIQELAHKTENVLSQVRSREMVPTPDVVNLLLLAFDRLRELVNNPGESAGADISEMVVALTDLTVAHLPPGRKEEAVTAAGILPPGSPPTVTEFDLRRVTEAGKRIFRIEVDLIHDVHRHGKTPIEMLRTLQTLGEILDATFDLAAAGTLDDLPSSSLPYNILFATDRGEQAVSLVTDVPRERIRPLEAWPPPVAPPPPDPAPAVAAASPAPAEASSAAPPAAPSPAAPPASAPSREKAPSPEAGAPPGSEGSLRVSVTILDSLMNLAGELVLSRNQLQEAIARSDTRAVRTAGQRVSLVTSELQEAIMLTRMQAVGTVFAKFPRVVRDLSRTLGKEVTLEITGKDVEVDKTIVEGLSDPLTHMVRNSMDHGIESPEDRLRAGKPSCGTLRLKAYHEAGQVVVEVGDDGKGIDAGKVAAAAVAKGLLAPEQAQSMSDKEKAALIFLPGLSTAEKVSGVSGRGVGMDVVKTNLDRLGGTVEIDTVPGQGTVFRIKLPLTLAIIPSLLVSAGGERFALPQVNVHEMIRIPASQLRNRIETVGDAEVLVRRGEMIPLVHLGDALGIGRTYVDPAEGVRKPSRRRILGDRRGPSPDGVTDTARSGGPDRRYRADSDMNVVIVEAGSFRYGLVVDCLHDTVEIVVKPVGRHLKKLREYAGATILGDGRVALIIDASGLASLQELASVAGNAGRAKEVAQAASGADEEAHSLLLFRHGPGEACAVPLGIVSRIEHAEGRQVERVAGRLTMQYRGSTLPLVTLSDAATVDELPVDGDRIVVVFDIGGREIGLLASPPVDILATPAALDTATMRQPGVMGSAIIRGETTMILDIFEIVEAVRPEWVAERRPERVADDGDCTLLLVEDSDFFRGQVKRYLESDGYRVIVAEDGEAGWETLQREAASVRLVVTDIEMPRLSGLGLTERIRGDRRFADLPVVALTSLAGEEDVAAGMAAGVDDYQTKLDKERLLDSVRCRLRGAAERRGGER